MPIYLTSILILSSHLRLGLPKRLYSYYNLESTPTSSHSGYMTRPSRSFRLITLTILAEGYKLCSSSLWSLLHSPFASLLASNIALQQTRPESNPTKISLSLFLSLYLSISFSLFHVVLNPRERGLYECLGLYRREKICVCVCVCVCVYVLMSILRIVEMFGSRFTADKGDYNSS